MSKKLFLSAKQKENLDALQEEQSLLMEIDGQSFIVVRWQSDLHIYTNTCPHLYKKLISPDSQLLDDSGTLIVCQHHGASFLPNSGICVSGPCTGEYLNKAELLQHHNGEWVVCKA